MDKINVIVPCYNYSNYLDLCLMSIFTQRVNCEVEIILSNDNSTDESLGIAERISSKYNTDKIYLKVFNQIDNIGEIENNKFLLGKCDGKYIAYLDADDYWIDPYKLQKQYDFMENNLEYSMCYTGQLGFDGVTHHPGPKGDNLLIVPSYFINQSKLLFDKYDYEYGTLPPETFFNHSYVFSSSRFFRNYRDLFQEYFYEFPYSDWPMSFELSLRGKIHYMNFASYVYRIKTDSLFHKEPIDIRESKQNYRSQLLIDTYKDYLRNKDK
jgi:glycosyltransferase involved in cell wall biosynthesis